MHNEQINYFIEKFQHFSKALEPKLSSESAPELYIPQQTRLINLFLTNHYIRISHRIGTWDYRISCKTAHGHESF